VFEFDGGLLGCEVPIGFGVVAVAVTLPRRDFCDEGFLIGDASVEALRGQNAEFGFGEIEPTAVFRGVPPPFERREHHEHVGRAVALVLVIDPRRLPFLHRHRRPRFLGELLGGFIQTNQGTIRIGDDPDRAAVCTRTARPPWRLRRRHLLRAG
jgi:hypothetical protein